MNEDGRRILRSVLRVGKNILAAPGGWHAREWSTFVAFAVATLLAESRASLNQISVAGLLRGTIRARPRYPARVPRVLP